MPSPPRPVVRVTVPAKINLRLSVGPRRPDGFHEVLTVFHSVDLADEVVAADAERISLTVTGSAAGVPGDASNLAWRAAELLRSECGYRAGVRLRVHKSIPVAGGMAGGSADAAGTLLACRALWGVDVADERLAELAAGLGSDVPFALVGGTVLAAGRGERLRALPAHPALHWIVVPSAQGISTPAAYAEFDRLHPDPGEPREQSAEALLDALASGNPARVAAQLHNDLQEAALALRPDLRAVLDRGRAAGALAGIVSGSGPTCVFLCASADRAAAVRTELPGSLIATGPARPHVCVPETPVPGADVPETLVPGARD